MPPLGAVRTKTPGVGTPLSSGRPSMGQNMLAHGGAVGRRWVIPSPFERAGVMQLVAKLTSGPECDNSP